MGFEQQDLDGSTKQFGGVAPVGPAGVLIPASPDKTISEVLVRCSNDQPNSRRLHVEFELGTSFPLILAPGEFVAWSIKSPDLQTQNIKQIRVFSPNGALYEAVVNFEKDL